MPSIDRTVTVGIPGDRFDAEFQRTSNDCWKLKLIDVENHNSKLIDKEMTTKTCVYLVRKLLTGSYNKIAKAKSFTESARLLKAFCLKHKNYAQLRNSTQEN